MMLALQCFPSNPEYNADFDYALVEITPELRALIEKRAGFFATIKLRDVSLEAMEFAGGYHPQYFSESSLSMFEEPWATDLGGGENDFVIVPEFTTIEDAVGWHCSESDRMIIDTDGVRWSCYPKYYDVKIITAFISYEWLEREMAA